ncbi:hypothetical protein BV898_11292 [Hypsibius exemplaris]|uniref:Cadherin domain-containing protein n=1 Tax=Hypsibius exemplaris TaxID=2072580 RepID=A0A1W0WHB1_HYPEX|nr:hypothetical protein BV898_11292 [Hypsibius exemplaris]
MRKLGGSRVHLEIFISSFIVIQWISTSEAQSTYSNSQSPQFGQSAYYFNLAECNPGQFVATVQARNPSPSQIAYSIDNRPENPEYMALNYQTGQLNLVSSPIGKFQFNYRATNFYGASVVPVTIRCGDLKKNGVDIFCFNNFCSNVSKGAIGPSFGFTINVCTPGSVIGTVSTLNGRA